MTSGGVGIIGSMLSQEAERTFYQFFRRILRDLTGLSNEPRRLPILIEVRHAVGAPCEVSLEALTQRTLQPLIEIGGQKFVHIAAG